MWNAPRGLVQATGTAGGYDYKAIVRYGNKFAPAKADIESGLARRNEKIFTGQGGILKRFS